MSISAQQAKTVSSIAAVASAFLVFVLGGGILLGIWASERADAEAAAELAEAAEREALRLAAEEQREARAQAERDAEEEAKNRRTTRNNRTKRARNAAREESATDASNDAANTRSKPAPAKPRGELKGRATVLVRGDATRVRLMGATGTYSAGPLPAGAYTVQATFPGAEPRMAGTVEIFGGQVAKLVCSSTTKTCSVR